MIDRVKINKLRQKTVVSHRRLRKIFDKNLEKQYIIQRKISQISSGDNFEKLK